MSPSNNKMSTAIITIVVISITLFEVMPQKSMWTTSAKAEEEHILVALDFGLIQKQKEIKSSLTNAKTNKEEYDEGKQGLDQHKKILIVDDDANITLNFKIGLENKGFVVDTFNDPLQAISKFKNGAYNLILLDIKMPKMNGFEVYRRIQKADKKVKVCFITTFIAYYESLKDIFPTANISCFIKKPIDIDKLVERVRAEISIK